jgi:D-alanyl-lipoteichoic acid acyltransferase DltB (MBOAT superfamily)
MVSGLWHGASWTFVCWGALHGSYLVVSHGTETFRARIRTVSGIEGMPRLKAALQILITFHLVLIAWVFFRASSTPEAFRILGWMVRGRPIAEYAELGVSIFDLGLGVAAVVALEIFQWATRHGEFPAWVRPQPIWIRWPVYYTLLLLVALFGTFSSQQFIYFQF